MNIQKQANATKLVLKLHYKHFLGEHDNKWYILQSFKLWPVLTYPFKALIVWSSVEWRLGLFLVHILYCYLDSSTRFPSIFCKDIAFIWTFLVYFCELCLTAADCTRQHTHYLYLLSIHRISNKNIKIG